MDLVTITDSNLGLSKHPVRITAIKENENGELDFQAEDFPWGTATPTEYPYSAGAGFAPNQQADPGSINTPLIFEPNNRLTGGAALGYEIWMGISGASPDWGGCHVWISLDGSTYQRIGTIHGGARMGVLTASLASHADPDTTNTLSVDLTESFGTLSSGSVSDADNWRTACIIYDGAGNYEVLAYQMMNLTSAFHYTSNAYLRRGAFSTPIGAHSNGALFARLDGAIFDYEYDPTLVGQTVFFKFTSFNKFELMEQSLANATDYTYTVVGNSQSTGLIHAFTTSATQTFAAGVFSVDIGPITLSASLGLKSGDHMTISMIAPISSAWQQVQVTVYCSADNAYHMVITNPGGAAVTLPSQNFAIRFYH
jgi:hypothetical protein